jgi:hypothetical protein
MAARPLEWPVLLRMQVHVVEGAAQHGLWGLIIWHPGTPRSAYLQPVADARGSGRHPGDALVQALEVVTRLVNGALQGADSMLQAGSRVRHHWSVWQE